MNTRQDQIRSLAKYDTTGIDAVVPFPELGDRSKTDLGARQFLTLHSMITLSADNFEDEEYEAVLQLINEGDFDRSDELDRALHERWNLVGGMSFPITDDGYLVTAAHVLKGAETRIVALGMDSNSKVHSDIYPCRIVFKDDDSDFAILKTTMKTPRFLQHRDEPLEPGEILFAGGWWNESGGGVYRRSDSRVAHGTHQSYEFERITTTIPLREKDSGSPLIDRHGRYCGVMINVVVGKFWKIGPKSHATMIDPEFIDEIIETDRTRYAQREP